MCEACRLGTKTQATHDEQSIEQMKKELDDLFKSYQGKASGQYDALLMFSGGKDSSLLLYNLKKNYPDLRILAVTIDNGFTSPIGFANVKRVSNRISDVDYLMVKPKTSLFRHTFRYALTHLNDGGCYASVDRLAGDLALDISRNMAASLDIPLLIHGGTQAQLHKILKLFSYESPRSAERKKRETTGGFVLNDIYDDEDMKYWWDGTAWPEEKIPRIIFPLYAWQYDEQEMRREVIRLGLFEEGNDNPIASNYDLLPINFSVDIAHLGYLGYEPEFSQLVREKKTDRNFWLFLFESVEYLAKQGMLLPKCIDDTLGKLNLTRQAIGLPKASNTSLVTPESLQMESDVPA